MKATTQLLALSILILCSVPAPAEENLGTQTVTVTTAERTSRIVLNAPANGTFSVVASREIVLRNPDGSLFLESDAGTVVSRLLPDVVADTVTVNGKTYSAPEMVGVLAAFVDMWRGQDKVRSAPPANP